MSQMLVGRFRLQGVLQLFVILCPKGSVKSAQAVLVGFFLSFSSFQAVDFYIFDTIASVAHIYI